MRSAGGSVDDCPVIASSADEWAKIIASYGRANEWAGISPGLGHRVSLAVVSSTKPWHQSSRVAATVRSPLVLSEGLDAASPVSEIRLVDPVGVEGVAVDGEAHAALGRAHSHRQREGAPSIERCPSEVAWPGLRGG